MKKSKPQLYQRYGGWVIEQIDSEFGPIDHPFGIKRHKISEMFDLINFARQSIFIKRMEKQNDS